MGSAIARFYVRAVNREGFKVINRCGEGHEVVADEPVELGGSGQGPNPIELFLASLASCFAITTRIFSRKLGVDVESVEVEAVAELDLRSVAMSSDVEPGLSKVVLKARVSSRSRCEDLDRLVDTVLRKWVVGSTVARAGVLRVEIEKVCSG